MRMVKFFRVRLEIAIFNVGRNFIVMFLQIKRNLNVLGNVLFHNLGINETRNGHVVGESIRSERGDVPGWVLVVLMTTGLVTAIWTIAAPRLSAILRNSLDAMNGIR